MSVIIYFEYLIKAVVVVVVLVVVVVAIVVVAVVVVVVAFADSSDLDCLTSFGKQRIATEEALNSKIYSQCMLLDDL